MSKTAKIVIGVLVITAIVVGVIVWKRKKAANTVPGNTSTPSTGA